MKISKYLLVLSSVILLAGCAEAPEKQTDESPATSTTAIESKVDNISSESTISNQIKNTSKLKFNDTITNIPDLSDVKSVEFERCDWTKTELTNSFIDAVNYFASSNSKKTIDLNDLSFDYIDSIEGDKGETIGRNLHSIYTETAQISADYNHYSGFFRVYSNSVDLSLNSGRKVNYFTEKTERELVEKADSVLQKTIKDYDSFFNNVDFEYFPFSYESKNEITKFKYGVTYKGIPLDVNYYGSIDHNMLDVYLCSNFSEVIVDSENNLLSLLSSYKWKVSEKDNISDIISLDKACEIVDSNISDNVVFDVTRVDFIYRISEVLDNNEQVLSWNGVPSWKFTIDATGIGEYQRLAFFVDAATGEFSTYVIVM